MERLEVVAEAVAAAVAAAGVGAAAETVAVADVEGVVEGTVEGTVAVIETYQSNRNNSDSMTIHVFFLNSSFKDVTE